MIPLAFGIFFGDTFPVQSHILMISVFMAICFALIFRPRYLGSLCIFGFFFLFGYLGIQNIYTAVDNDPILKRSEIKTELICIIQDIDTKQKGCVVTVQNLAYNGTSQWIGNDARGKIFCLGMAYECQQIGDTIMMSLNVERPSSNRNPNSFDYTKYLRRNKISYQGFVTQGSWNIHPASVKNNLNETLLNSRNYCQGILDQYISDDDCRGIASALILGNRDPLSDVIMEAYSDTGAIHVLAVSGLHVFIIAGFLHFILGIATWKNTKIRKVRLAIVVLGVWIFAIFTGSSPSVIRASMMFSIIAAGSLLGRDIHTLNAVCVSAVGMLIYNPLFLFQIGFQFSYLAVFGILLLYKRILPSVKPRNFLLNKLWSCIKVSFAAQAFILPLSIYYFQKVSLLFWLSSPIVIFFASLLLPMSMFLFFCSLFSETAATWIAGLMECTLKLFYTSVQMIQKLPYCSLDHIYIDEVSLVIASSIIIFGTARIISGRIQLTKAMTMLSIVWLGYLSLEKIQTLQQKKIHIYESSKTDFVDIIIGQTAYAIYTNDPGPKELTFLSKSNRLQSGVQTVIDLTSLSTYSDQTLKKEENIIYVKDRMIVMPEKGSSDKIEIYHYNLVHDALISKDEFSKNDYAVVDFHLNSL